MARKKIDILVTTGVFLSLSAAVLAKSRPMVSSAALASSAECPVTPSTLSLPTLSTYRHVVTSDISDPDLGLGIRGFFPDQQAPLLFERPDPTDYVDPRVPDITTVFDTHPFEITKVFRVHDWDWSTNQRGRPLESGTMIEIATQPNLSVRAPSSGYNIAEGKKWHVIFAKSDEIAINATRNGDAVDGYTISLLGLTVRPEIVTAYTRANRAGRHHLPALGPLEKLGCTNEKALKITIRDSGTIMRANDKNDWGHNPKLLSRDNRP